MTVPVRLTLVMLLLAAGAQAAPKKKPAQKPGVAAVTDENGPEILLDPVLMAQVGQGAVIEAEITDKDGVFAPKLSYRAVGDTKYVTTDMVKTGMPDRFRAEIPGSAVSGSMEFYIEAYDQAGNGPSRSAPATRPHKLIVGVDAAAVDRRPRAPEIVHEPVTRAPQGRSVPIEASFKGPSGVYNPVVFFRSGGSPNYTALAMAELPLAGSTGKPADPDVIRGVGGSGRFVVEVPAAFTRGDLEYFIEAMDAQGNGPSRHGDREHPHAVRTFEETWSTSLPPADRPVDPNVAMVTCLEVPKENEAVDPAKVGVCRRMSEGLSPDAIAKFGLGELKLRYENYPDAADAFDAASTLAPTWPAAQFRAGQAAELARRWQRAAAAYGRYLEITGKPPEYPVILKRLASIEYELGNERREAQEAQERLEARKRADEEKVRLRAEAQRVKEERQARERLLSSPGNYGLLVLSVERWAAQNNAAAVHMRFKFKPFSFTPLFLGLGVSLSALGNGSEVVAVPGLSGLIGLNFLSLPARSAEGYTLLSPFVAWQPRVLLLIPGASGASITSNVMLGNHFEFGRFTLELAVSSGGVGARPDLAIELALGQRLGDDDE